MEPKKKKELTPKQKQKALKILEKRKEKKELKEVFFEGGCIVARRVLCQKGPHATDSPGQGAHHCGCVCRSSEQVVQDHSVAQSGRSHCHRVLSPCCMRLPQTAVPIGQQQTLSWMVQATAHRVGPSSTSFSVTDSSDASMKTCHISSGQVGRAHLLFVWPCVALGGSVGLYALLRASVWLSVSVAVCGCVWLWVAVAL